MVTRLPPGTGVTSRTFLVSRACALLMLATTWYTQVLPTATGNGIDPGATTEPVLAVGVAVGLVVPAALETAPAGLFDAADDVAVAEPHPASATTAAPARTARADLYLLMLMPSLCEGGVPLVPPCRKHGPRVGAASPGASRINAI